MAEPESPKTGQERRTHPRKPAGLLQMVNLGAENGGLMLDLSEGGLAMHAVYPVAPEPEIPVNFLLPNTDIRIDAKAQVAWGGHSKQIGLQFTDIPAATLQQIRDWLNSAPQFEDVFAQPLPDSLQIHSDLQQSFSNPSAALQSPMEKTIRYVPDFAKPIIAESDFAIEDLEALPTVQPVEDAPSTSPFAEKTLRYVPPFARRKSLRPKEEVRVQPVSAGEIEDLPEVQPLEDSIATFFSVPPKSEQDSRQSQNLSGLVGRLQVAKMTESLAHVWRWPGFVDRLKSLSPAARQHLLYELDFQARALSLWLLEIEKGQQDKAEANQADTGKQASKSVRKPRSTNTAC
jgi:hypothetical protein